MFLSSITYMKTILWHVPFLLEFTKVETGTKSKSAELNRALKNVRHSFSTHIKHTPPKTVDSPDSQLPKKVD